MIVMLFSIATASCVVASIALGLYLWRFSGQPFSPAPSDWGVFGDFVGGILNPLIALVNISVVVFIAYEVYYLESAREDKAEKTQDAARDVATERAKQDRAIALHEYYLSPEFYSKVRSPAYQVALAWADLPEPHRAEYRRTVVRGWAFIVGKDKLELYASEWPTDSKDMAAYHFQNPKGLTSLTEHQALSAPLRYWTRIRILLDLGMIDPKLVQSLFKDEFGYLVSFFRELSAAVSDQTQGNRMSVPRIGPMIAWE